LAVKGPWAPKLEKKGEKATHPFAIIQVVPSITCFTHGFLGQKNMTDIRIFLMAGFRCCEKHQFGRAHSVSGPRFKSLRKKAKVSWGCLEWKPKVLEN